MSAWVYDNDPEEWELMEENGLKTFVQDEGVEEREVVIYEGAEINRQPNSGSNTEEKATQTERDSKPQQGCCSKRSFIAGLLSLTLLCLLLLSGIVTLELFSMSFVEKQQKSSTKMLELSNFCKDGCRSFNQSFYYISTETKTWEDSRQDCKDRLGDLIIINSREEQEFVRSLQQNYWIGLSDREEEGMWKWVDGSILNTTEYWTNGMPRGWLKGYVCVLTRYWGKKYWEDARCHTKQYWICEKH